MSILINICPESLNLKSIQKNFLQSKPHESFLIGNDVYMHSIYKKEIQYIPISKNRFTFYRDDKNNCLYLIFINFNLNICDPDYYRIYKFTLHESFRIYIEKKIYNIDKIHSAVLTNIESKTIDLCGYGSWSMTHLDEYILHGIRYCDPTTLEKNFNVEYFTCKFILTTIKTHYDVSDILNFKEINTNHSLCDLEFSKC